MPAAQLGGAQYIHMDVMDGNFVPNISFRDACDPVCPGASPSQVFDVHLMVKEPHRYIQTLADCGADLITVHVETCDHLDRVIQMIRDAGKKAGVSLNPATSLSVLDYVLDKVDMVLIMTVNPGFGGRNLSRTALERSTSFGP